MATVYSDINAKDLLAVENLDRNQVVTNLEAVYRAIDNILATSPDERLFNLDVTANLESFLFALLHEDTADLIYESILTAVEIHEPRVRVLNAHSRVDINKQRNGYDIDLAFSLRGLEDDDVLQGVHHYRRFISRAF